MILLKNGASGWLKIWTAASSLDIKGNNNKKSLLANRTVSQSHMWKVKSFLFPLENAVRFLNFWGGIVIMDSEMMKGEDGAA